MSFLRTHLSVIALFVILLLGGALMINSSIRDSATMDELAHIPAGYGYVKYLDFRLNPEHPPLLKALSALPLLFVKNLTFPTDHYSWKEAVNGQWDAGTEFLYHSGNSADQIIGLSRLAPILLTLITAIFVFVWSRELMGKWWAILATFIFALSPHVLAHGHYVTTDIAATFGLIVASYYFLKVLERKQSRYILFAGIAFGVAELMKFSMALLVPFFIILSLAFAISTAMRKWDVEEKRIRFLFSQILKYLIKTLAVFGIGLILIYAVYALFTWNYPIEKQITDTEAILGNSSPEFLRNLVISLSSNHATRPLGEYLLGLLMVVTRSAGGNTNYFLGEVSNTGSVFYFPIVYLLKESLPVLILIILGIVVGARNAIMNLRKGWFYTKNAFANYFGTRFGEFAMLFFIIFYFAYSMRSPLNIGLRHILPTLPFIYILAVSAIQRGYEGRIAENKKAKIYPIALGALVIFAGIEIGIANPHFLSYFNEMGGGVSGGYRFVTDSNYDWGQDLKALREFTIKNNIQKIAVDYFGGGNPKYYLGEKLEPWWSARGNPKNIGIEWLAVSVNTLQGSMAPLSERGNLTRKPEDEYRFLEEIKNKKWSSGNPPKPDFRVGTSIFIYQL